MTAINWAGIVKKLTWIEAELKSVFLWIHDRRGVLDYLRPERRSFWANSHRAALRESVFRSRRDNWYACLLLQWAVWVNQSRYQLTSWPHVLGLSLSSFGLVTVECELVYIKHWSLVASSGLSRSESPLGSVEEQITVLNMAKEVMTETRTWGLWEDSSLHVRILRMIDKKRASCCRNRAAKRE